MTQVGAGLSARRGDQDPKPETDPTAKECAVVKGEKRQIRFLLGAPQLGPIHRHPPPPIPCRLRIARTLPQFFYEPGLTEIVAVAICSHDVNLGPGASMPSLIVSYVSLGSDSVLYCMVVSFAGPDPA